MAAKAFLARHGLIALAAATIGATGSVVVDDNSGGSLTAGFVRFNAGGGSADQRGVMGSDGTKLLIGTDANEDIITIDDATNDRVSTKTGFDLYSGGDLSASQGQTNTQTLGVSQTINAAVDDSVLIGDSVTAGSTTQRSVVVGYLAADNASDDAVENRNVVIGALAFGDDQHSVVIGYNASSDEKETTQIGYSTYGGGAGNIVIGWSASGASVAVRNAAVIGHESYADSGGGIAIGTIAQSWFWNSSPTTDQGMIAIGPYALATGDIAGASDDQGGIAIGWGAASTGESAVWIGRYANSLVGSGSGYHQQEVTLDTVVGLSLGDTVTSDQNSTITGTITAISGTTITVDIEHIGYRFEDAMTIGTGTYTVTGLSNPFNASGIGDASYSVGIGGFTGGENGAVQTDFIAIGYGATVGENNIVQLGGNIQVITVADITSVDVGEVMTGGTSGATGVVLNTVPGYNRVFLRMTSAADFQVAETVTGTGFSTTVSTMEQTDNGHIDTVRFSRGKEDITIVNPLVVNPDSGFNDDGICVGDNGSSSRSVRLVAFTVSSGGGGIEFRQNVGKTSSIWTKDNGLNFSASSRFGTGHMKLTSDSLDVNVRANIKSGLLQNISLVGSSTTLSDSEVAVKQTAGGITTTLWASPDTGDTITIRNAGGGAANTIDGNGNNIEGAATFNLNDGEAITLVYDGTEWTVF